MANNQFSLKNATVQPHGLAPVGVMQPGAPMASRRMPACHPAALSWP